MPKRSRDVDDKIKKYSEKLKKAKAEKALCKEVTVDASSQLLAEKSVINTIIDEILAAGPSLENSKLMNTEIQNAEYRDRQAKYSSKAAGPSRNEPRVPVAKVNDPRLQLLNNAEIQTSSKTSGTVNVIVEEPRSMLGESPRTVDDRAKMFKKPLDEEIPNYDNDTPIGTPKMFKKPLDEEIPNYDNDTPIGTPKMFKKPLDEEIPNYDNDTPIGTPKMFKKPLDGEIPNYDNDTPIGTPKYQPKNIEQASPSADEAPESRISAIASNNTVKSDVLDSSMGNNSNSKHVSSNSYSEAENTINTDSATNRAMLLSALEDDLSSVENIHPDLAKKLNKTLQKGLLPEERDSLFKQYAYPMNCKFLRAPVLNEEIMKALNQSSMYRDKKMSIKQDQLGLGITAIGKAMTLILSRELNREEEDLIEDKKVLRHLSHACRLLADLHYQETDIRRVLLGNMMQSHPILKLIQNPMHKYERDDKLFGNKLTKEYKAKLREDKLKHPTLVHGSYGSDPRQRATSPHSPSWRRRQTPEYSRH